MEVLSIFVFDKGIQHVSGSITKRANIQIDVHFFRTSPSLSLTVKIHYVRYVTNLTIRYKSKWNVGYYGSFCRLNCLVLRNYLGISGISHLQGKN